MNKKNCSFVVFFSFLIFVISGFYFNSLFAQDVGSNEPGATSQRLKDTLKLKDLQQQLEQDSREPQEDVIDGELKLDDQAVTTDQVEVVVKKITTDSSKLLSQSQIQKVISKYEGKKLTIKDLSKVVDEINALYKAEGHIGAKAFLPPQKINKGIIKIRLIESRVGEVFIEENKYTRDSFFQDRITLSEEEILDLKKLEEQLFYFNQIYDVKARAVLKPGDQFATTNYVLKIQEPKKYSAMLFGDNAGRDDIGLLRGGVVISDSSLFGHRDKLTVGVVLAEGTEDKFASYIVPIGTKGTKVSVSYDYSEIEIKSGTLKPLNVTGASTNLGFFVTHPVVVNKRWLTSVFSGFNTKRSITQFSGFTALARKVRTINYGLNSRFIGKRSYYTLSNTFTHGFRAFRGNDSFAKYNGDLNAMFYSQSNKTLLARVQLQLANHSFLPASEQFQLGGMGSVRGYASGVVIGDNGYLLSAEYSVPLISIKKKIPVEVRGSIFVDHGALVKSKRSSVSSDDYGSLTGAGIGLTINITEKFTSKFIMGVPLESYQGEDTSKPRFHFEVQYNF
ncbi:MAG: ShlB/FhaC/HecB family hemolysin secretion/activation protein [Candidatus Omnitrophica bacterium]|nr:ShlB/FhaC/HecB family hemolysin secretion/activation protein [Candidatus Omnitrophota bacterium]